MSSTDLAERTAAVSARISASVGRAFHAIGAAPATQELVYWNLSITKNLARNEVAQHPEDFIEGIKGIFGEAGTAVFEYALRRELRREFNLPPAKDDERLVGASELIKKLISQT